MENTQTVSWPVRLAPYAQPSLWKSLWQILNTAGPFFLLWTAGYYALEYSYWLTLLLAIPTAGFLVRLFIIQHDCGHGSFFRSQAANDAVGYCIGFLTLLPYAYWLRTHAIHHATSGNLDQRGYGDISTLTVKEYLALPRFRRLLYRLYRHPIVLLGIGPTYQFAIKHRFPISAPRSWKREWISIHITNLAILAILYIMSQTIGLKAFLAVQLPVFFISGLIGVWQFYVQHQFEETYWQKEDKWNYFSAGFEGSSYYQMPRVFQWITGNIGFHHIHHMVSLIPNYRLQECFDTIPELQNAKRITMWGSLKCFTLALWDEDQQKLIRFRDLRTLRTAHS